MRPAFRIDALFNPRSVAIVGASVSRTHAVNPVKNMRAAGFAGSIFAVHPTATAFMDMPVYRSIIEAPAVPECAIFALGADKVVPALREAAQAGIKAAVIYASGFGELDETGRRREAEIAAIAREHAIAVCGPNGMGLFDLHSRFAGYSAPFDWDTRAGDVAVLSHSGSGCVALANCKRFGIRCAVSAGNSTVIDVADYLEYLAEDPHTRVAAVVLETVRDPQAFRRAALRMHEAGKPVVVLKNGRSAAGAAATAAHTGALAGAYEAFLDFFARCGVIAVEDLDELIETVTLIEGLKTMPAPDTGLGLITVSGGEVALACDIAAGAGTAFPALAPGTLSRIEALMPKFAFASNPLDARTLTPDVYEGLVLALADDPRIGIVASAQNSSVTLTDAQATTYSGLTDALAKAAKAQPKPIAFYNNLAVDVHPLIAAPLIDAGIPMLRGARPALRALGRVLNRPLVRDDDAAGPAALSPFPAWQARLASPEPFTEREAKRFLQACGVPVPREELATTRDEAALAAQRVGFPVALKVESPDLPHKTEVGGVCLSLANTAEVREAFDAIIGSVGEKAPRARVQGVSVQEMVGGGCEVLLGLSRPEPFGLALTVGAGGTLVELIQDARLVLLPASRRRLADALGATRIHTVLQGFRGAPAADISALLDLMERLAAIAAAYGEWIEAIDLNPVSVQPQRGGAVVLDALIVTRAAARQPGARVDKAREAIA